MAATKLKTGVPGLDKILKGGLVEKSSVLVSGGPGTGKSVIAVNILGEVAQRNKNVFYGCKSKPFTEGNGICNGKSISSSN